MKEANNNKKLCARAKCVAYILTLVSIGLIIGSFYVPPTGVIDGSVIAAVGELFAFAALFAGWEAIDRGLDAKITHGNTSIDINNPDAE